MTTVLMEIGDKEIQVPEDVALALLNAEGLVTFANQSVPYTPEIDGRWVREDEYLALAAALRKLYRAQCRDGMLGSAGYIHVAAKEWCEVGLEFQNVINEKRTVQR